MGWPSSSLCVKSSADGSTHTHTSPCSVLVLSSIPDGPMAWPLALISAQPMQAALALAPCPAQSHVPWATGSGCLDLQVLPGHCPCTQGVLGQHLHMTAIKCQGKAPCCSTSHREYPMEMRSPVLSSMGGSGPSPCGPGPLSSRMMLNASAGQGLLPTTSRARAGKAGNGAHGLWYMGSQSCRGRNAEKE